MAATPNTVPKDAWNMIDPASLDATVQTAYSNYKTAYAVTKAERQKFEEAMTASLGLPAGKRALFGYNFGKLSVAVIDGEARKPSATQAMTLEAFKAAKGYGTTTLIKAEAVAVTAPADTGASVRFSQAAMWSPPAEAAQADGASKGSNKTAKSKR